MSPSPASTSPTWTPAQWWRQLSWLPQRPVLVPGTVRDNLELFGALDDLESACTAAGFDAVLAELPDGLDTALGRGGVGLSLGQRQRLGLARALGSSAPVLLLDEPTAHLDAGTEARVLQAIVARARAGATVVVVGHRERVIAIGDRVVDVVARAARRRGRAMRTRLIRTSGCGARPLLSDLLRPRIPRLLPPSRWACCRWAARWRWPGSRRG